MRWAWNFRHYAERERMPPLARALLPPVMARLRAWDRATAGRVHHFMANSPVVAGRIQACYDRAATVIPPPVDVERFVVAEGRGAYFLVLSRLVPYKRIDLAVRACTLLGLPLRVIGAGRDLERLRAIAGPTVQFLGAMTDAEVQVQLAGCRALIFPGEEDFGITAVEAQACGRPVIAYGAGGALATVIPGRTGLFFSEQTEAALSVALEAFRDDEFDPHAIRRHAETFATERFYERVTRFVAQAMGVEEEEAQPQAA